MNENDSILINASSGLGGKKAKRRMKSIGKKVKVDESANRETIIPNRLDNQMFVPKEKARDTEIYEKGVWGFDELEAEDKRLEDKFLRGEERYIEQHYAQSAKDNAGNSYKIYSYTPEEYDSRVEYFLKKYPNAIRLFGDKYSKNKIYDDLEKYYLTVVPSEQRRSQKSKYAQFALRMNEYTKTFELIKSQIQSAFENDIDEINNYIDSLDLDDPNVIYDEEEEVEEQESHNLQGLEFSLDDIRTAVAGALAQLKILIEQIDTFVPENEFHKLTASEADQLKILKNRIKSFYAFLSTYNVLKKFRADKAFLHQERESLRGHRGLTPIDYLKGIFGLGTIQGAGWNRKGSKQAQELNIESILSDEDIMTLLGFTKTGRPYIKGGALFSPNIKLSKATLGTLKKIGDIGLTNLYLTEPLNTWEFRNEKDKKMYYITISKDKTGIVINQSSKPDDDEEIIPIQGKQPITINDIINRTERTVGVDDFHNHHPIHNTNKILQRQLQKSALYFIKH